MWHPSAKTIPHGCDSVNFHTIESPAIHRAVAFLVDHLPGQAHLVITTRVDPPLPLARYRSRRQLTEVRTDDLRFTPDETARFLGEVMGLSLLPQDMALLTTRTEGWIAGLQLAGLSLEGRTDSSSRFQAAITLSWTI